jgi:5-bromo-4-chloroindolyl phosphate hydrolysis protein
MFDRAQKTTLGYGFAMVLKAIFLVVFLLVAACVVAAILSYRLVKEAFVYYCLTEKSER